MTPATSRLVALLQARARGRRSPLPSRVIAAELGVSQRDVGTLVAEAIERGAVIGSSCQAARPGYFWIVDPQDLEPGVGHIVARAAACFRRVRVLRRAVEARFGPQPQLFDLEDPDAA
jgi:hypothetical protein